MLHNTFNQNLWICVLSAKNWFMSSKKKCLCFNIILKQKIIVSKEKLLAVNETKF